MAVTIRSSNDILTQLIARILADTDLTDVSPGSELSKILEAVADEQYLTGVQALTILQASNLDNLVGKDLDAKANDLSLPDGSGGVGRIPAKRSAGTVTVSSSFTKRSVILYPAKPAPYIGAKVLYLQTAEGFPSSGGQIYIGRGTDREEGPLTYTSLDNTTTLPFYTMTLSDSSPITKNHIVGEYVTLAQGGIRTIPAGTSIIAPSVNSSPSVSFTTDTAAILLDGESSITIAATCVVFGTTGNIQANSISQFASLPFTGATVTNASAFSSGQDIEDDNSLRQRIKDYSFTLSRGTARAIQSALRGLSDPVSGKTIISPNIVQPTVIGNPSRAYVDDGQGLEPAYLGQPFESLVTNSSGNETLFRTARSPVLAPIVFGSISEPYQLSDGQTLIVQVDDTVEVFTVNASNYVNVASALASEVVNDFNSQNNKIRFRTSNNSSRITAFDLNGDGEILSVQSGYIQSVLGLPVTEVRPLFLYKNNQLLNQKGITATINTNIFPWVNLSSSNLVNQQIEVDGVIQTFTVSDSDFAPATVISASISQWVTVLSKKISGVSFTVVNNTNGTSYIRMQTRQGSSANGTLRVITSDWMGAGKIWDTSSSSLVSGKSSDYSMNRFSGQIELATNPTVTDNITIGSTLTRGSVYSKNTATSQYPVGETIYGTPKIVVASDGDLAVRDLSAVPVGAAFSAAVGSGGYSNTVMLRFNNLQTLQNVDPGDFIYLAGDTSYPSANQVPASVQGLYRIKSKGFNTTTDSYNLITARASFLGGTNTITVTTSSPHRLITGQAVRLTASGWADSSRVDSLSNCSGTFMVQVIDTTSFTYQKKGQPTYSASTGVNSYSVSEVPFDSFVTIQLDRTQRNAWAAIGSSSVLSYSQKSLFIFKAEGTFPQVVDFGSSGTLTVDQVVSIINSNVSCLTSVKESPRRLFIRTNNYKTEGNVGVLAVIGSAVNMFSVGVSGSVQTHTGSSMSGAIWSGGPKITTSPANYPYLPTRSVNLINVIDIRVFGNTPNPSTETIGLNSYPSGLNNLFLNGPNVGLNLRSYNFTGTNFPGFIKSVGNIRPVSVENTSGLAFARSIRMEELPLGVSDRLVVTTDNDETSKTSTIPVSKSASLMAISIPSTTSKGSNYTFTLADDEDKTVLFPNGRPLFDATSVFRTYDLTDMNVLFKPTVIHYIHDTLASYYNIPTVNPTGAVIIRSTQWGNEHKIAFVTRYAEASSTADVVISHKMIINPDVDVDSGSVTLQVYATLPTGPVINGSVFSSSTYTITPSDFPWTTPANRPAIVQLRIASPNINSSNLYQAGNYLNIASGITYSGTYLIVNATANQIDVVSPGIRAATYSPISVDASVYPISSYNAAPCTIKQLVDAINAYSSENPVATASFVTSTPSTMSLSTLYRYESFYTQGNPSANNSLSTLGSSLDYHSITSTYGCTLNIHRVTVPTSIDAISQYTGSPCLTSSQIANTGYSYVNEPVRLMPATSGALTRWLNFKAMSSLSGFNEIERCGLDRTVQISSKVMGSKGSVQVKGVKANSLQSSVVSNPEIVEPYMRVGIAAADAESLPTGASVLVQNSVASVIRRPFAFNQTGSSVTTSNTTDITSWFRPTTTATYSYVNSTTGRFTFSPTPLSDTTGITITLQTVDVNVNLYVKRVSTSTAVLNARVGEMFYVKSSVSTSLSSYLFTEDTPDQYFGHPVIAVESPTSFLILTTSSNSSFTYSNSSDAGFIAMIKTEKNIPSETFAGGAYFKNTSGDYPLDPISINALGGGLMMCTYPFVRVGPPTNPTALEMWGLSNDDFIRFGTAMPVLNRGMYRVAGMQKKEFVLFYNPNGIDQVIDKTLRATDPLSFGSYTSYGSHYGSEVVWDAPVNANNSVDEDKRTVRIYDANSVFEGDYLQVKSPSNSTFSWFSEDLLSKFKILEIGLTPNFELYVNFETESPNLTTQSFTLGVNNGSFEFIESTPYYGIKQVVGSVINNQQSTYSDIVLAPSAGFSKISPSNGTYISALHKMNFNSQINRGVDGYTTYSELLALAATVIDGSPTDSVTYPGVRAAGTAVDIQAPLVKSISLSLTLQATNGVGLSSIKDPVKSTITNYIKGLGVGESVVLSEIIKRVQQMPGVLSVVIDSTVPAANNGIISVASIEVARVIKDSNIYI